jgi:hypothetical protein
MPPSPFAEALNNRGLGRVFQRQMVQVTLQVFPQFVSRLIPFARIEFQAPAYDGRSCCTGGKRAKASSTTICKKVGLEGFEGVGPRL